MHSNEYRCPNCLKDGKTGLNLGYYLPGVPLKYGMPMIEITPPYWIICLTCYANDVPGLNNQRGLVMEVSEGGFVMKLEPENDLEG
jgi:hypothetical protein